MRPGPAIVAAIAFLAGCGGNKGTDVPVHTNKPPTVHRISLQPPEVLPHQNVNASVVATDPEGVPLLFRWSATRGIFPLGSGASSVTWLSPEDPGTDTLTVKITDRRDTTTATVISVMRELAPPESLRVTSGTSIANLFWDRSPDSQVNDWQGYEIYQSTRRFELIPPDSLAAYRIAGPIEDESYRAPDLQRGVIYYFCVGALRSWADREQRSRVTAEVESAPRPEWTKQMQEVRNPGGSQSIDLSTGDEHPLNPADASGLSECDLYFGTSDGSDGPGPPGAPAAPRLKSVSRLADRNPAWAARVVRLKFLGMDWTVSTTDDSGWSEEVDLIQSGVYAVLTPEGNYAKIQVVDLRGVISPYWQLTVHWAYQQIPNYPSF